MCIIIAKRKNGRIPTEKELLNAFEYNNDGAGFMYVDNNEVIIDKGYMKFKDFIKRYNELLKKYNNFINKSLVIHCRIGTSGKNTKGNTHPYPITNNSKELRNTFLKSEIGIAHNGIIKDYELAGKNNDTQEFIMKYLYPIYSNFKNFYKNKYIMKGIEEITSSKFVILDKKDNIYKIGDFIEDKGLYFSNSSYQSFDYTYGLYNRNYYYSSSEEEMLEDYNEMFDIYEEDLYPLESSWFIDYYGNGNVDNVGNKDLYFNIATLDLVEFKDGDFKTIAKNPIIYDEKLNEVF